MDDQSRRDIMRIASFIRTGKSFADWGREWTDLKGRYDPLILADYVDRARTVANSSESFGNMADGEPLRNMWGGGYSGSVGGPAGPLETDKANIFGRVNIQGTGGRSSWRSFRLDVLWDMTVEQVLELITSTADEISNQYGYEAGVVPLDQIRIH